MISTRNSSSISLLNYNVLYGCEQLKLQPAPHRKLLKTWNIADESCVLLWRCFLKLDQSASTFLNRKRKLRNSAWDLLCEGRLIWGSNDIEVKKRWHFFHIWVHYCFSLSLVEPWQHFILALGSTACPLTPVNVFLCASLSLNLKKETLTRNLFASWWASLDPWCLLSCQAQSFQTIARAT